MTNLDGALAGEETAVKWGMSPSAWVMEQPKVWEKSAEALLVNLEEWESKRKELRESVVSSI